MYDQFQEDFKEFNKDFPKKKTLQWGRAIKAVIEEKKAKGENISIPKIAKMTGINDKNLFNIVAQRIQDPSSDKLLKIADALGISFNELVVRALGLWPGSIFFSRFADRGNIEYGLQGFSIQALTPPGITHRDFFVGRMRIKPFQELKKWKFKTGSTVFLHVESGTLEFTFGNKSSILKSNESVYFDGSIPHKIKNIDSFQARIFLVTRPSLY
ncbi:MAG: cupin domain-containing protein [Candidatus Omnitrophica bacterium]|nr:cupin domain-containing protein [Candidatus Omnitrophota bacterium]